MTEPTDLRCTRLAATPWSRRRALAAVLGGAAIVALSGCGDGEKKVKFNATDITGASFGRSLNLTDAATKTPRSLADYRGRVPVLFFGYLFCPDYCPTTMTTLNAALAAMKPEDAARVQVLFVTLDPARDTPEQLTQYVRAFNPSFAALYGSEAEIAATAKEFKIFYQKADVKDDKTYLIDHSTQMYAFDPEGRLRLMIKHEAGPEAIASDLTTLARS